MNLYCTVCKIETSTTVPELMASFRAEHTHSGVDAYRESSQHDEFGEIFKEEKPALSLVEKLDAQEEKGRPVNSPNRQMNSGYRHQRDKFERHLILDTVFRFQDNVTILDFHNFIEATLKAFDDAHTSAGVGPYDTDR